MRSAEISIFLFIIGLLGVNWPLLEIFHTEETAYLMSFWFLFIVALALAAHMAGKDTKETGPAGRQTLR